MIEYICDKCKKRLYPATMTTAEFENGYMYEANDTYHFCEACTKKFLEWVEEEDKDETH